MASESVLQEENCIARECMLARKKIKNCIAMGRNCIAIGKLVVEPLYCNTWIVLQLRRA